MSVWAAPWMVAAASGSASARARAVTVRMAWRNGRLLSQRSAGDAAGGEARGEGPVAEHGGGEGHLGEFGGVLVVGAPVGCLVEQGPGAFGFVLGERLGERDEADGDV